MGLFYGMPEVLNRMRDHLRTFAEQRVLPPGGDFSEASVRHGTMALVQQALPLLQSAAVTCLAHLFLRKLEFFSYNSPKQMSARAWTSWRRWEVSSSSVFTMSFFSSEHLVRNFSRSQ